MKGKVSFIKLDIHSNNKFMSNEFIYLMCFLCKRVSKKNTWIIARASNLVRPCFNVETKQRQPKDRKWLLLGGDPKMFSYGEILFRRLRFVARYLYNYVGVEYRELEIKLTYCLHIVPWRYHDVLIYV